MIFDDPDLTNTVKDMGAGGIIAAALWALWSKLRAITAGDKSDAAGAHATTAVYDLLLAENKRMATLVEDLSGRVTSMQKALDDERDACRKAIESVRDQHRQCDESVAALKRQIAELMDRIEARESEGQGR